MSDDIQVFDRRALRQHRDRAARGLQTYDFLLREVADRLADRLLDIQRRFPLALDIGCHGGELAAAALPHSRIDTLIQMDLSPAMLRRASGLRIAGDEESLPFADASFDLVASSMSLHWTNDLPGALLQARRALKPDGLLLAALPGGDTLWELRECLLAAEMEISGGASPRTSPMADLRDLGGLMQRAGFALPVIDSDRITLTYADPFALFRELRGLGEANTVARRNRRIPARALFVRAAAIYHERFADADGRIPTTFDIVYLTGWVPHESQPRPLRPGSAEARLADALCTSEQSAGEKIRPR
jgi:NADH dehydrogenase [ubiquinone] 1 alpha subcomplex assembly factor 5